MPSFLTIECHATLRRFRLFPFANLRALNVQARVGLVEIFDIIDSAKSLDILALDFDSTIQSGGYPEVTDLPQAGNVRFPPAVDIRTDDPSGLIPSLKAAASMIKYLRLTVKGNMVHGSEVKALLSAHDNWHMNISC